LTLISAKDVFTVKATLRLVLPLVLENYQDLASLPTSVSPVLMAKVKGGCVCLLLPGGHPPQCRSSGGFFCLELFVVHQYPQFLRFLLDHVALDWYPAFPEVEQKLLFDDVFLSGNLGKKARFLFGVQILFISILFLCPTPQSPLSLSCPRLSPGLLTHIPSSRWLGF